MKKKINKFIEIKIIASFINNKYVEKILTIINDKIKNNDKIFTNEKFELKNYFYIKSISSEELNIENSLLVNCKPCENICVYEHRKENTNEKDTNE